MKQLHNMIHNTLFSYTVAIQLHGCGLLATAVLTFQQTKHNLHKSYLFSTSANLLVHVHTYHLANSYTGSVCVIMLQAKMTDFQTAKKFCICNKIIHSDGYWKCNIFKQFHQLSNIVERLSYVSIQSLKIPIMLIPTGQLCSYRATQHNSLLPVANTKIKITDIFGSATWSKYNIANMNAEKSKSVMSINYTVRGACVKHNNYYEQNFSCINGQLQHTVS